MAKTADSIREYVVILFTLLGALFGGVLMAFIFGNLGPSATGLSPTDAAYNITADIQNNSLTAINSYSAQASTQVNVVAIAIILVILIGVFLLFWKIFVGKGAGKKSGGSDNFM